jgi:diacylglycerol kinase family enzyme
MRSRRVAAIVSLALFVAAGFVVLSAVRSFPRGLIASLLLLLAFIAGWEAIRRRGIGRIVLEVLAVLLLVGTVVAIARGGILAEVVLLAVVLVLASVAARAAFRIHVQLPTADPPKHPVVIWNPKSGGGKAAAAHLDVEARARGIEPIQLSPGDDLFQLARDAVERGADALAAAGGDGTQAIIATIAAELDLPFACIPAGTRNHFALDLGLNRDDPRASMSGFTDAVERRVDYARVDGRLFVNNVSLGIYATVVQSDEYRDAKAATFSSMLPKLLGPGTEPFDLQFSDPDGREIDGAFLVMVSNNPYVIGKSLDDFQRRRLDTGQLGVIAVDAPGAAEAAGLVAASAAGLRQRSRYWHEFALDIFEIRSRSGKAYVGIDGEALEMDTPLRFEMFPEGLRLFVPSDNLAAAERRRARDVRVSDLTDVALGRT